MRTVTMSLATWLAIAGSAPAEDWIIGAVDPNESVTITTDRFIDGDIVLVNSGRLTVTDGARLSLSGRVELTGTSRFEISGAGLRFVQLFSYQSGLGVWGQSAAVMTDAVIDGNGQSFGIALAGSASVHFTRVTVEPGFATWALFEDASATLTDCTNGGEFLEMGTNTLAVSGTETVLFWLTLPDGAAIDTTLPAPGAVASFTLDPNTPWASGIPYACTLTDCTNVSWGSMARSGSSATYRNSELLVAGSLFERDRIVEITGVANSASLADSTFDWGDVHLRFVDCTVGAWNFYAYGDTRLTIEDSVFGELLVTDRAQAQIVESLCDGSGGYMGVSGEGQLLMFRSTNLSQMIAQESGVAIVVSSALLDARTHATDNAIMVLSNAQYTGEPAAHDAATILDYAIEPALALAGDPVPLRGTARVVAGPQSVFGFTGYQLEWGAGPEPQIWTPIGGPRFTPVRDAELGVWESCGRLPLEYTVRLTLVADPAEPLEALAPVTLFEPPEGTCLGDLDCDGGVFLSDLAILMGAYGNDGNGDLDGDGDTDLSDLSAMLANWASICSPR